MARSVHVRISGRLPVHRPLPAPEAQGGEKILQREGRRHRHHLPGWVIEVLREPDDEALGGGEAGACRGMAIGEVLEERLRVDRLGALVSYAPTPFVLLVQGRSQ
jgi:hypothetical protein